ncbi:putative RNA-binding protein Luc7-like 1 [Homalodisca vitripennis]|nr:putative RNA-binding protein Luc7-like 1 [Homalodisca vitripennis]
MWEGKSCLLRQCSVQRMDLGECPKIHDLALRADFEQASRTRDYFYDIDAMEHLQAFISDCDKRTELAKQRLLETQEELSAEVAVKANHVHELAEEIGKKLARAEQLGEEGFVEESLKLMGEKFVTPFCEHPVYALIFGVLGSMSTGPGHMFPNSGIREIGYYLNSEEGFFVPFLENRAGVMLK